ncbi:unnamed protein product [Mytilus coruscus]|uniref:Uncharacterized protein n=1 Tax=Mytilus coruscus TaxID=42192 RepID=A0A6J8EFN0_MYTCO|nr:unnamed protein product [Mytilus coruscus]
MQGLFLSVCIVISLYLHTCISLRMRSCVLRPVQGDTTKYKVYLTSSRASGEFRCADGTHFNQKKCLCVWPPRNKTATFPTRPRPTRPRPTTEPINRPIKTRPFKPIRPIKTKPLDPIRPLLPGEQKPGYRPFESTTIGPCFTSPDADRNYFSQYIHGYGTVRRRCPIGTLYNDRECGCIDLAPVTSIYCRPEINLEYDSKPIKDNGGTHIPIGNNGHVDSVAKAGRFNGIGQLTVWMYSNIDFGQKLTISLRFYDFPGGPDEQVLVSNCMDSKLGAVEIALAPRNKEVIFRADTVASGPAEIRLPYKDKAWKNVTYVYDGTALRAKVDDEEQAVAMKGHLDTRAGGFEIGMCNRRGYVGYIDDLKVHRCVNIDYVIGNGKGPLSPYDARGSNLDIRGP